MDIIVFKSISSWNIKNWEYCKKSGECLGQFFSSCNLFVKDWECAPINTNRWSCCIHESSSSGCWVVICSIDAWEAELLTIKHALYHSSNCSLTVNGRCSIGKCNRFNVGILVLNWGAVCSLVKLKSTAVSSSTLTVWGTDWSSGTVSSRCTGCSSDWWEAHSNK